MPITLDTLKDALNAGVKEYNLKNLGWFTGSAMSPHNKLYIGLFNTSGVSGSNRLMDDIDEYTEAFFKPAETHSSPNTVYSYLSEPVVRPINISGGASSETTQYIAFGLGSSVATISGGIVGSQFVQHTANIPSVTSTELTANEYGDVFLIINLESSTVPVTTGGYLTVKGYTEAAGAGSKLHTYVTLESGS